MTDQQIQEFCPALVPKSKELKAKERTMCSFQKNHIPLHKKVFSHYTQKQVYRASS